MKATNSVPDSEQEEPPLLPVRRDPATGLRGDLGLAMAESEHSCFSMSAMVPPRIKDYRPLQILQ